MINNFSERPRILFLFSDTGGGHRSAAEAIIEALQIEYGNQICAEMIDILLDIAPLPFNKLPEMYPHLVRLPPIWGVGYRLSNGPKRARLIADSFRPYLKYTVRNLMLKLQGDLIVSVHPLANAPILHALGKNRPPFVTVVTDMVSTHAFWYDRRVDLCLVATEEARRRAIRNQVPAENVRVTGLPVANRFYQPLGDRRELRQRLGWPQDLPVILLVGGGEGMGPLGKIALAISEANLPASLVIVAGRNEKLRSQLAAMSWKQPTFIYGFVRNMPDMMAAANILVTKAGPGTITEALNVGLPMILYSRLPGQEDGNVMFVTEEGAGFWAPEPQQVVQAINNWLQNPAKLAEVAGICNRLARPDAARQIAHILVEQIGVNK